MTAAGWQPGIPLLQRCVERAERLGDRAALEQLMERLNLLNYKIVGAAAKVGRDGNDVVAPSGFLGSSERCTAPHRASSSASSQATRSWALSPGWGDPEKLFSIRFSHINQPSQLHQIVGAAVKVRGTGMGHFFPPLLQFRNPVAAGTLQHPTSHTQNDALMTSQLQWSVPAVLPADARSFVCLGVRRHFSAARLTRPEEPLVEHQTLSITHCAHHTSSATHSSSHIVPFAERGAALYLCPPPHAATATCLLPPKSHQSFHAHP